MTKLEGSGLFGSSFIFGTHFRDNPAQEIYMDTKVSPGSADLLPCDFLRLSTQYP